MIENIKNAKKAKDKIMSKRCKNCNRTMEEGGFSGTLGLCASCLKVE